MHLVYGNVYRFAVNVYDFIKHDEALILIGGALGDHALPWAHGKIDVLCFMQNAKYRSNVEPRIETSDLM